MPRNDGRHKGSESRRGLLRAWHEWETLLSRQAIAAGRQEDIEETYLVAYGAVLAAIEQCSPEECDAEVLHKMQKLVTPWNSLNAFRTAPARIQEDLLTQCRVLEHALTGRTHGRRFWTLSSIATSSGGAALVTYAVTRQHDSINAFEYVRHWCYRIEMMVLGATLPDMVLTGTLAMLMVGWWFLHNVRHA